MGGPQSPIQCFVCGGMGHLARNCPQVVLTRTVHPSHVRAKISQVGDQTIMTSNKGWSSDLSGPPPWACHRCGGMHWDPMFPCCPQRTVSPLPQGLSPQRPGDSTPSSSSSQDDMLLKAVGTEGVAINEVDTTAPHIGQCHRSRYRGYGMGGTRQRPACPHLGRGVR